MTFKVWSEDSVDDPRTMEAPDEEYAVIHFAEDNYVDYDYPSEMVIFSKDKKGIITEWTVSVEHEPTFYAKRKQ